MSKAHLVGALLVLASSGGHAAALKLATWDLGWLTTRPDGDPALPDNVHGKSAQDLAILAGYAARLDADVVALQGVDDAATARAVFPADRYDLVLTSDAVIQHTGFAVRRGLPLERNPDLAALDVYGGGRLPLRSGADITVGRAPHALRLLSVHLKSGCRDGPLGDATPSSDRPACVTLARQAAVLAGWVRDRRTRAAGGGFGVLGDFGRPTGGADDLAARIAGGGDPLLQAAAGHASPCWGAAPFVDDMLLGGAAAGWVHAGSLRVMVFTETGAEWRGRLSGHCPVSVRIAVPE